MGALAVLIVEQAASSTPHAVSGFTYICVDYDQRCIPGGNKYLREGFAGQDMPQLW